MVEVYNESVYDLLVSPDEGHEKLTIQSKGKNVTVPVRRYIASREPCNWHVGA